MKKAATAWALFNHKIIEPMYECKEALWVAEQLADRLGIGEMFREGHVTRDDWMQDMVASAQEAYPDFPSLEEFKKVGIYKVTSKPTVAFEVLPARPGCQSA